MRAAIGCLTAGGVVTLAFTLWAGSARPALAETYTVVIRDFGYGPDELTVRVGDTVTFVNEDGMPHTATTVVGGAFDTGEVMGGQSSDEITFKKPGTYQYTCSFHPAMAGVIVVKK